MAETNQIPAFLVNAGLSEEQTERLGQPRTGLPNWIGVMLPDDRGAGFDLANALIDEALRDPQRLVPDGRVHIIGVNGVVSDGASIQRLAGLRDAIAKREEEAVLDQVVAADWKKALARQRSRILHRRYPNASVIWSASDPMAEGVIEAMKDRGKTPGTDVIIGGVDATPEALDLVDNGSLHATVGGHIMEGGWVAVLLYDFLRGVDSNRIPTRYASPMILVTRNNVDQYRAGMGKSTWEHADFRQFSLKHHPENKGYHFDMRVLSAENSLAKAIAGQPEADSPSEQDVGRE